MKRGNAKDVRARAQALGIEIEVDGPDSMLGMMTIQADAPDGFRFAGTQTHGVCARYATAFPAERPQAWGAIADDIAGGFEPCPTDCECRDEE